MRERTFHRHVNMASIAGVVIIACAALYFLWHRAPANIIIGACLIMLCTGIVERLIHTTYTLTGDGLLIIDNGRFSRCKTIALTDIRHAELHHAPFHVLTYVLINYGGDHYAALTPVDAQAFVEELSKRLDHIASTNSL